MKTRLSSHSTFLLLLILSSIFLQCSARKQRKELLEEDDDDIPGVPWLVETIGEEIYRAVNRPKYRFYIYMTVGKLPDENSTVALLSTLCNVLYGLFVLIGFMVLPRGKMLFLTMITILIGPALVLILLGCAAALIAAFAMYPITSVSTVWLFFFLTSHIAQALGRKLGLDSDNDGDVDMLDLLHFVAKTRIGTWLGLPQLHAWLDDATRDPFQEIHRRLDRIQEQTDSHYEGANGTKKE